VRQILVFVPRSLECGKVTLIATLPRMTRCRLMSSPVIKPTPCEIVVAILAGLWVFYRWLQF
jgi:hypothetical protein